MAVRGWLVDNCAAARETIPSWARNWPDSPDRCMSVLWGSSNSFTPPGRRGTTTPFATRSTTGSSPLPSRPICSTEHCVSSATSPITTGCGIAFLSPISSSPRCVRSRCDDSAEGTTGTVAASASRRGDLSGQILATDLLARLRPDACFASLDELIAQMQIDKAQARDVLAREMVA